MPERTPLTVEQAMALKVGSKVVVLIDKYDSYTPGDVLTVKRFDTSDDTMLAVMSLFSPHDVALYEEAPAPKPTWRTQVSEATRARLTLAETWKARHTELPLADFAALLELATLLDAR